MRRVLPRSQFRHDLSPQLAPDVGTGPFGGGHHVVAGIGDLARWAQPPTRARRTRGQLPGSHNPQGVTVLGVVYLLVPFTPTRSTSNRTPRPSGTSSTPALQIGQI